MKSIVSNHETLLEVAEEDKEGIQEEVETLQERFNALEKDVDEKLTKRSNVEKAVEEVGKLKAMQARLIDDVERKLVTFEGIGSDMEKAKVKADEIEVLQIE